MITPEQARADYGFADCTTREDNMTLGLYHAAQGLFSNRLMQIAEYSAPLVVIFLALAALAGIITAGLSPMLLLILGALAIAFIPHYLRLSKLRRENSGMCHIRSELGNHFLISYGTCSKKETRTRHTLFGPVTDYTLRIVFSKHVYLDNVRIMKELYEQVGEGARVCLMMADSPKASQIIAAPTNFTETVIDKKGIAAQQFEAPKTELVRELSEAERTMYISQYQDQIQGWNRNYGKKYLFSIVLFFIFGLIALFFGMQGATTISWVLVVAVLFALLSQKKEFRYHKTFLQKEPVLTAVDVLAEREDSYTSSNGTKKRPNSAVHFKDRRGAVLWTLRTSEDLKNFQPHEQAVLIIHGNEMLPLHKDSAQFTLSQ